MAQPPFAVHRRRYDDAQVFDLIEELQAEYVIRYGSRDETPVDPDEFAPPAGSFLVAYHENEPVGCGGLRRHDDAQVEGKRMFVRSPFRGQGLSRLLLAALEDEARALGYRRILMETGTKQPEAMALYESSGFMPIPGFGFYRNEPANRCYAKDL